MKSESLAYPYIVIEGNIGVGKTTFCRKLQEKYDARLILEQFSENPFLPFFYENPERHAFSVELFFMTERHRQLQEELYLHRPVPNLLHQIKKRGRSFEMEINTTYLENIQKAYFDFFKMDPEYPILVVGIDDLDFEKDNNAFELLNKLLLQNYEPKVHYINLKITP